MPSRTAFLRTRGAAYGCARPERAGSRRQRNYPAAVREEAPRPEGADYWVLGRDIRSGLLAGVLGGGGEEAEESEQEGREDGDDGG